MLNVLLFACIRGKKNSLIKYKKFKYFSCYNTDKDDKLDKRESSPKRLGGLLSSSRSQNNIESNESPSKKKTNKKESQFVNKLLEANESADESSATDDLTLERSRPNVGKIRDEYGEIELMIQYDTNRNKLLIKVNQAKDLINTDRDSLSDPYVRFVLQPDKKNKTKRKTKVIKDTLTPNWEELFEFDLHHKNHRITSTIIVAVVLLALVISSILYLQSRLSSLSSR